MNRVLVEALQKSCTAPFKCGQVSMQHSTLKLLAIMCFFVPQGSNARSEHGRAMVLKCLREQQRPE